ncbi:SgcJ/EcaC family oxidoreductase [Gordonia sp. CPCC 206044]|uniref:YybH family protein n=1 Tax=Gordonia sp. CPCC 206044 TaxID=3140793 RepID=UPI003AF40614
MSEHPIRPVATSPEDITRLFVEFSNAGDADGVASLYHPDAVMAYPPGRVTRGRDAIRDMWAGVLAHRPTFTPETPLPTICFGADLALTSTPPGDGAGARAQVVQRQDDGSWVRIIDQPEFQTPTD